MPTPLISEIVRRFKQLKSDKWTFNTLYQEIAELVLPTKSNITIARHPGEEQTKKLFDSTAIQARRRLSATLQSTLTSTNNVWFDLVTTDVDLMEFDDVRRWLTDSRDRMFSELQHSNMDAQFKSGFDDIVSFGSMLTLVQERKITRPGFNGLTFQTFDVSEYVWEEDQNGLVNAVYRQEFVRAREAAMRWGEKNLTKHFTDAIKNNKDDALPVIHAVFPRADVTMPMGPRSRMPWASIYISEKDGMPLGEEGGFRRFPYLAPRWTMTRRETYGRSPSMEALPDIRTLNRIVELELRAMVKAINPMLVTSDESALGGEIVVRPGGQAFIRQDARFEYLESKSQFAISNLKKSELVNAIMKAYLVDQLELPPPQGTPMTATEIDRRVEQMIRLLGPELAGLNVELLRPLLANTFDLMWFGRAFLPPPARLLERAQGRVKPLITVQFKGPLARAQKMGDVIAYQRWVGEAIVPVAQVKPDIVDIVDFDAGSRMSADRLGVPMQIVRTPEAVEQKREERKQQEQELLKAEMENRRLEAAGKAAPAVKALEGAEGA